MDSLYKRTNSWFASAPQLLVNQRYWVILLFAAITIFASYGLVTRFTIDKSMEAWFSEGDKTLEQLDAFRAQFGSDDGLYIVYKPADGDVFSYQSLKLIAKLHQEIDDARFAVDPNNQQPSSALSRIKRLTSLYNAPFQKVNGDTLRAQELLRDLAYNSPESREKLRRIASKQSSWQRAFFSPDFQFAGIRIKTDFGAIIKTAELPETSKPNNEVLLQDEELLDTEFNSLTSLENTAKLNKAVEFTEMQMEDYLEFMAALKAIIDKPSYKDFHFYYSGTASMYEFSMQIMQQAALLLLLMVIVMVGLLWFFFRSLSAVISPILVIAGSASWTLGLFAWLGIVMSEMANLTFMLVLAVGIADSVHVLSAYSAKRREGQDHNTAIATAYAKTGLPILLTSLTTMVGMLCLLVSDIPQIITFGISSAIGVMMAFILTLFVLPSMLSIWQPYSQKENKSKSKKSISYILLKQLPLWVENWRYAVVLLFSILFVVLIYGITQVKIDTNIVELTKEGSPMRQATEVIDKHMMGAQNMELMVNFNQPDALKDAKVLQALDSFQQRLAENYPDSIIKSFSIAEHVKETYKVLNNDNPEYFRIPDNSKLTAQLLYLFDNANPEDRQNLVSDDYSVTHISLMLKNAGSHKYTKFFDEVQKLFLQAMQPLKRDYYPELEVSSTGALTLMIKLIDHVSRAQIQSFALVLTIISLILALSLSCIRAGLLAIIPNLLPAVFVSGFMGLMDIPLDTDTLIIAPIIIGIAVDDTIHFMVHYRQVYWQTGDIMASLIDTTTQVGRAVLFTSLILALGFGVLSFSDYLGMAKIGFGSLAILLALLCDLLLLPALILIFKPSFGLTKTINVAQE